MIKICLIRGSRISLMLAVLLFIGLFVVFYTSLDVKPFQHYVELHVKKELQAEKLSISNLALSWDAGPVVNMGQISLTKDQLTIHDAHAEISYSIFQIFRGSFAPKLALRGGSFFLNLDIKTNQNSEGVNLLAELNDVQLQWRLNQETQYFDHVNVTILPYHSDIFFKAKGVDLAASWNDEQQLKQLRLHLHDFSGLPKSWLAHMTQMREVNVEVSGRENQTWLWEVGLKAEEGLLRIPDAHIEVPITTLHASGEMVLQQENDTTVLRELVSQSIQWRNEDNFGDFTLHWQNNHLQMQAVDASVPMPMLWSWLWMLSSGEKWQQWLSSMDAGRVSKVKATIDLPWHSPLQNFPTEKNVDEMQYVVDARVQDADIGLGTGGDYLYHVNADVKIDTSHLEATIDSAELQQDVGKVSGDYTIAWSTLVMEAKAKGLVDVGKLHHWLDAASAKELVWGTSPASAELTMIWDINKEEPDVTKVYLKPIKDDWVLQPKGIKLKVDKGLALWDINRGLDLKNMKVKSPWFDGRLTLFLNKKRDWSLQRLHLDGSAPLAKLTRQFSLPITKPEGQTSFILDFKNGQWKGDLNLTKNNWLSFAGFDKLGHEKLHIRLSGKPTTSALLPIHIEKMKSPHKNFSFESKVFIDDKRLDFHFQNIITPEIHGSLRLLMPLDTSTAWGLEANTEYLDKALLNKYFEEKTDSNAKTLARKWSVFADTEELVWGNDRAKNVHFQFSSDKQSTGSFTAGHTTIGQTDLANIKGSFTLNEKNKIDIHYLEADGSDQHVVVTGSVKPQKSGVFNWSGMAFLTGKFGTLMKQAELNKLFQEGEMSSLFLGEGSFKEGEPWWRGMQGSFRLRVDDGRIMEGGTLTHLLAAISLIDLPKYLLLQREDIVGKGLFYDQLQVEATFHGEQLAIDQLAFRSSALEAGGKGNVNLSTGDLDILLIARPWQNIEAIVGNIPLLGSVLAGEDKSFLRKVYRIHGPASDAAVDELQPEDAGLPRSGLLEQLFSLPSQWFAD